MNALRFAWRDLVRQPARAALGIFGVAAVGALLLDMLLLSNGLVQSMADLLDRTGFDIRATVTGDVTRNGPKISGTTEALAAIARLPEVRGVIAVRMAEARIDDGAGGSIEAAFDGVAGRPPLPWTVIDGRDVEAPDEIVVNRAVAEATGVAPGDTIAVQARCQPGQAAPPAARLRVAGIAEFPFDAVGERSIAGPMAALDTACGGTVHDESDVILAISAGAPDAAARAMVEARPGLRAMTNTDVLGRLQQTGFSYFQQISAVLGTVTFTFALLLIGVLLTVSVNQRLGEIAALRAIGCTRARVVAGVLAESAVMVGSGGLVSLPLGAALATGLDRLLTGMPGLPAAMHFFVFDPAALAWHGLLLLATAVGAAAYPMVIVARLPIATTLRNEVGS